MAVIDVGFGHDQSDVWQVEASGMNVVGMTMTLQFVANFGFILPVNAP